MYLQNQNRNQVNSAEPCDWLEGFILSVQQATGVRLSDDMVRVPERAGGVSVNPQENPC
jgi:hypothetical protein